MFWDESSLLQGIARSALFMPSRFSPAEHTQEVLLKWVRVANNVNLIID